MPKRTKLGNLENRQKGIKAWNTKQAKARKSYEQKE